MLIIPTVYWYSDGHGNMFISNSKNNPYIAQYEAENSVTVNKYMGAFAHTCDGTYIDGVLTGGTAYPFIAIGVYEAFWNNTYGMMSKTGVKPDASKTISGFRTYVTKANDLISDNCGTYSMWNFYQYSMYKILAQAAIANKDAQSMIGIGNAHSS